MHNDIERRLVSLEGRWGVNQRGAYDGLVALYDAGVLTMNDLSDQELWWIIVGRAEDAPSDEAEFERRLADVVGTSSLPTVDGS